MPKYEALFLLWSPSQNRYIEQGEIMEISDDKAEDVKVLLEKGLIRPAVSKPTKAPVIEQAAPVEQAEE